MHCLVLSTFLGVFAVVGEFGRPCYPVTVENAGSNPAGRAETILV